MDPLRLGAEGPSDDAAAGIQHTERGQEEGRKEKPVAMHGWKLLRRGPPSYLNGARQSIRAETLSCPGQECGGA